MRSECVDEQHLWGEGLEDESATAPGVRRPVATEGSDEILGQVPLALLEQLEALIAGAGGSVGSDRDGGAVTGAVCTVGYLPTSWIDCSYAGGGPALRTPAARETWRGPELD